MYPFYSVIDLKESEIFFITANHEDSIGEFSMLYPFLRVSRSYQKFYWILENDPARTQQETRTWNMKATWIAALLKVIASFMESKYSDYNFNYFSIHKIRIKP